MKNLFQRLVIILTAIFLLALGLLAPGCSRINDLVGVVSANQAIIMATPAAASMITLTNVPGTRTWVHPGAVDSKAELDFVKAKIQAGAQPWKGEFDRAKNSSYANQTPHALAYINSPTEDANISRDDALGAYTEALLWYYSSAEAYAQKAVAILNAWSALHGFIAGSEQDRLQAGWIGAPCRRDRLASMGRHLLLRTPPLHGGA